MIGGVNDDTTSEQHQCILGPTIIMMTLNSTFLHHPLSHQELHSNSNVFGRKVYNEKARPLAEMTMKIHFIMKNGTELI